MTTHNIAEMQALIAAHADADTFTPCDATACAIGCLSGGKYSTATVTERFGIPEAVQRIQEHLFDRMSKADATQFMRDFGAAVAVDGKDLSRVHYEVLWRLLGRFPKTTSTVDACVVESRAIMRLLADGADPESLKDRADAARAAAAARTAEAAARTAARTAAQAMAAEAAARTAAEAAARTAAEAAARAAEAARTAAQAARAAARAAGMGSPELDHQRRDLLEIIANAPVREAA